MRPNMDAQRIKLNSKVTLEINGKSVSYILVPPAEIDLSCNKISVESPLGQGLMKCNAASDHKVCISTPMGIKEFQILKIENQN